MCLVLTGIHAYLGVHVLSREVVFVDIALAQIAALGATAAFLLGWEADTWESYAFGLSATLLGALVLALTRSRRRHVSQEAVIGVVYAVSSAAAVLLSDRAAHGAEQVRAMLVGNLLAVRGSEVVEVAVLYATIGIFHWLCRRPFFLISTDPDAAFREGRRVRLWDFLFYASFGVVGPHAIRLPSRLGRVVVVLATLVAGCASLPPPRPIDGPATLAGTWRGRMTGPMGNAPVLLTIQDDGSYRGILYVEPTYKEVGGVISVIDQGRIRYEGTDGNGRVTLHERSGRWVLRFVRDGGGGGAELIPAK